MRIKLLSLFSGIGAFEKALKNLNIDFELINYCEIDKNASKAYCLIHDEDENKNLWNITKVKEKELLDFDLMTYGFPCQPFSMAGLRNGKLHKSGNLFFDSMRIAEYKKPKWMIAENVKGLLSIDNGQYLENIILYLGRIGYNNYFQVLNAKDYGIPQNRERIFIISIRKDVDKLNFEFPKKQELKIHIKDIIDLNIKKYLTEKQIMGIKRCNRQSNKNFFVLDGICPCLTTMDGGWCKPKIMIKNNIRQIIPRECFLFMGFIDDDYDKIDKQFSNRIKYKLAGNSIVVNVLEAIFKQLFLGDNKKKWLF